MGKEPQNDIIDRILNAVGVGRGSIYKIRFGGIVGKIALVCAIAEAPIFAVAARTSDPHISLACLIAAPLVAIVGGGLILYFGHKHPEMATLEGGQIIAMQQLQNQYAAKDVPQVPQQPSIGRTISVKALQPPSEGNNQGDPLASFTSRSAALPRRSNTFWHLRSTAWLPPNPSTGSAMPGTVTSFGPPATSTRSSERSCAYPAWGATAYSPPK